MPGARLRRPLLEASILQEESRLSFRGKPLSGSRVCESFSFQSRWPSSPSPSSDVTAVGVEGRAEAVEAEARATRTCARPNASSNAAVRSASPASPTAARLAKMGPSASSTRPACMAATETSIASRTAKIGSPTGGTTGCRLICARSTIAGMFAEASLRSARGEEGRRPPLTPGAPGLRGGWGGRGAPPGSSGRPRTAPRRCGRRPSGPRRPRPSASWWRGGGSPPAATRPAFRGSRAARG